MKTFSFLRILILGYTLEAGAQDFGDSGKGAELYYNFGCYSCHGYNATMRVRLTNNASDILSSETLFLSYLRLRADRNPVNPNSGMPNYAADTLSDSDALDIYAYIKSVRDSPPNIRDIPVMRQMLNAAEAGGTAN